VLIYNITTKRNVPKPKKCFLNGELYRNSKNFVITALSIITPFINQTSTGSRPEFLKLLLDHRKEIESLPGSAV
jgi:hypothetical protein